MSIGPVIEILLVAAARCTAGAEFEPPLCPTGLPAVRAVQVEENGIALWREDPLDRFDCARFQLSERLVQHFFRRARQADARAMHFTLPESPCSSRGRVTFADGSAGRWRIDRFGLGWLDRPGHAEMVLYCRACRSAPFEQ